jgi:hypothetical protein
MKTIKEKKLEIALLKEKIERISGKKVIFEGSWMTPKPHNLKKSKEIISQLETIKDKAYNIFGSDEFFNGLDIAISESKRMLKEAIYLNELSNISSESSSLFVDEFEEYISDYTTYPENHNININTPYYKALLWAQEDIEYSYAKLKEFLK